jgi:hypothetical protein
VTNQRPIPLICHNFGLKKLEVRLAPRPVFALPQRLLQRRRKNRPRDLFTSGLGSDEE